MTGFGFGSQPFANDGANNQSGFPANTGQPEYYPGTVQPGFPVNANHQQIPSPGQPEYYPEAAAQPWQASPLGAQIPAADAPQVVASSGASGQVKCPKCGATDITPSVKAGELICGFCRNVFEKPKADLLNRDIFSLQGVTIGAGAQNIIKDEVDTMTLQCSSCGAEVVINTANSTQSRCHWCRNYISINNQIPNGAVPDVILPFSLERDIARGKIQNFVDKRKFFAHPQFVKEFSAENINGVYFPYMVIDVYAHAEYRGKGEITTEEYEVKVDGEKETRYTVDTYQVERAFDIGIDNIEIESNSEKFNLASRKETNNVINALMPFDVENSVAYDSNYLRGFTSERRDTDIQELRPHMDTQARDIARISATSTLGQYRRGVRWENESFEYYGESWSAAYLPVWLYSYRQNNGLMHYIAVNGRSGSVMGSVPLNLTRLSIVSAIIELLALLLIIMVGFAVKHGSSLETLRWVLLLAGPVFFYLMYSRYRNISARFKYETHTNYEVRNLQARDSYLGTERNVESSSMHDANADQVHGIRSGFPQLDQLKSMAAKFLD